MNSGRFYEDYNIGDIYKVSYGRTVTESDNTLLTALSLNNNPLHFDEEYCKKDTLEKDLSQ